MKAIVTGATGFLGKHLCNDLSQQGWSIIALGRNEEIGSQLNNKNITFKSVDLNFPKQINDVFEECDVVFHCAAFSSAWGAESNFYDSNVTVTKNILFYAGKYNIKKMIHVSSTSVYFDFKDRFNISETDYIPNSFANTYANTKYLSEKVLLDVQSSSVERIIIRPRGIIGEGDNAIMPRILRVAEKGRFPLFHNGNSLLDITYVKNVTAAMIACAVTDNLNGHIFNISNDEPKKIISILMSVFSQMELNVTLKPVSYSLFMVLANILEAWSKLSNGNEPIITKYGVGLLGNSQTLNINKAKLLINYQPIYSLDEGIAQYAQWQRDR